MRLSATLLLLTSTALAHDPGLSTSRVHVTKNAIVTELAFNNSDFTTLLPEADTNADGVLSARELIRGEADLRKVMERRVRVASTTSTARLAKIDFHILEEDEDIVCTIRWQPLEDDSLSWHVDLLALLSRGHRQYAVAFDAAGSKLAETLLSNRDTELVFTTTAQSNSVTQSNPVNTDLGTRFLHLGVEHILIGYDHILFLLGLLLVCGSWRQIALTITAFTAAHSITLAAASLGVVRLPGSLVEAVIALSIVYVGVKNVLRRGQLESRSPFGITFAFGLVHGFGFASVLAEIGLEGTGDVIWPLVTFNAGVELGQLAIAGVFVPLLWCFARRNGHGPRVAMLGSVAVTAVGAWWFIERTLLA